MFYVYPGIFTLQLKYFFSPFINICFKWQTGVISCRKIVAFYWFNSVLWRHQTHTIPRSLLSFQKREFRFFLVKQYGQTSNSFIAKIFYLLANIRVIWCLDVSWSCQYRFKNVTKIFVSMKTTVLLLFSREKNEILVSENKA